MKILTLYSTSAQIYYKHSICSCAAFFVFISTIFVIITPFYFIIITNNDLWYQPKIFYEQPTVSFQYKYILLCEHSVSVENNNENNDNVDDSPSLAIISSFGYFNQLTDHWQKRSTVRYWMEDFDHNHVPDRMHFQFAYEPSAQPLKYINLFLELDAYIENHHCKLHIPAAVVLFKEQLPLDFLYGHVTIEGKLILEQKSSFFCPYFMRNVISNFYYELIPNNSANILDYEMATINQKLSRNVGFIRFDKTNVHWDRSIDNMLIIDLSVEIGETATRFHATFWQKLILFWTEYLAVLVIFLYLMDKLKLYMFSRQLLRAWTIIPWKKIY